MPESAYTSFGASRKAVDRAGEMARDYWAATLLLSPVVEDAFTVAWTFRAEFQRPLTKVVMGLRSFTHTEEVAAFVAQRLKRMPTILDKLTRHPMMKLSRMQDIGGCRVIVEAGRYDQIDLIRARMVLRDWKIIEEYDYVTAPKPSGYRAIHVVVRRDDRLIEIQLRTAAQHRWAETVERLGSQTGFDLKDGDGPKELLLYLERAGYGTALMEAGETLPDGFIEEFAELTQQIQPYLRR